MEYELHPDRTLTPLPQQNIDTGLGLERTAQIVQNVGSVYDTDGYQLIMAPPGRGHRATVCRPTSPSSPAR